MASGYADLKNELVSAANGVAYAYRDTGGGGDGSVPLVLLQHFRGNLDDWDPALVDALSSARRVVAFDNVGVGGSTGTTPDTIEQMARDAIAFIAAMGFDQADAGLSSPPLPRRARPACTAGPPRSSARSARRRPARTATSTCFSPSRRPAARPAGKPLQCMYARTEDRDTATTWATREAQYDAVCMWGIPDHAKLQRLSAVEMPVFVANGDSDPMIRPHYSYLLAGLIPQAKVKIYPDAAHGFLFQHHAGFAADVDGFLTAGGP